MSRKLSRSIAIASASLALLLMVPPSIASATPPSNDDLASPTIVSAIPFTDTLSTEEATTQVGEPNSTCSYALGGTVWYEFTPQAAGVIRADTQGSDFDTVVSVWTEGPSGQLSEVTCDDEDQNASTSTAHFLAAAGTRYLIQVGGYYNDFGNLIFNVSASTAGSISGTVTSSEGGPLDEVCVWLWDADGDNVEESAMTAADGSYFFGGVSDGAHTLEFYDCDERWDHLSEWWDDRTQWHQADDVIVSGSTPITGIDAELTKIAGPEIYVNVTGSGTVTSEPGGIDCGLDCSERFEWESVVTLTATPSPGAQFLEWYNCDRTAGNQCQVDMDYSRYVYANFTYADTHAPNTSIYGGPDRFTSSRSARFELYSDEWPEEFECSLDGGGFERCVSPAEFDGLADGTHELQVRAIDQGGNVDPTPSEWRWTVDTTLPELRVERPKAGIYVNNMPVGETGPIVVAGMVSVEVRAHDAESGITGFRFELNGAQIEDSKVIVEGDLYRFSFRPATPGVYDIRGRATNGAGESRSVAFQVIGAPAP